MAEFLEQFQGEHKVHIHTLLCRMPVLNEEVTRVGVLLPKKRPAGLIGGHDARMVKSLLPVSWHRLYSRVTSFPWRAASLGLAHVWLRDFNHMRSFLHADREDLSADRK